MPSKSKIVRVTVSAMTRLEYSVLVRVPANATDEQLEGLVGKVYDDTDGSEYWADPDYFERGSQTVEPANPDEEKTCEVLSAKPSNGKWAIRKPKAKVKG